MTLTLKVACVQEPSTSGSDSHAGLTRHTDLYQQAELYYAYDLMHKSSTCPFRTVYPATLLNAACFLLMHLPKVTHPADNRHRLKYSSTST